MSDDTRTSVNSQKQGNKLIKLVFGILLIGFGLFILLQGISSLKDNKHPLNAPKGRITVEKVESTEAKSLGLSGRAGLAENTGMLFIFDESKPSNCFWMKEMKFSIDMVWMDEDKRVVTVHENVSPETYPQSFCPNAAAKYGLELPAGDAAKLGIEPNAILQF